MRPVGVPPGDLQRAGLGSDDRERLRVLERSVPEVVIQPEPPGQIERDPRADPVLDVIECVLEVGKIVVAAESESQAEPSESEIDIRIGDEPGKALASGLLGDEFLVTEGQPPPRPAHERETDACGNLDGAGIPPPGRGMLEFIFRGAGRYKERTLREDRIIQFDASRRFLPVQGPRKEGLELGKDDVPVKKAVDRPRHSDGRPSRRFIEEAGRRALGRIGDEAREFTEDPPQMLPEMILARQREPVEQMQTRLRGIAVRERPQARLPGIIEIFRIFGKRKDKRAAKQKEALDLR